MRSEDRRGRDAEGAEGRKEEEPKESNPKGERRDHGDAEAEMLWSLKPETMPQGRVRMKRIGSSESCRI